MKFTTHIRRVALSVLTMTLGAAAVLPQSMAAEKVSARTVTHTGARSGSILSNKVAKVEVPQSVFVDTTERNDPFFPDADYRKNKQEPSKTQISGDGILKQLKLNGFGGIGNKRWAMINGVSIYQTEPGKVMISGKNYKIVCLEIKDQSVVVGIENSSARRELKLDK